MIIGILLVRMETMAGAAGRGQARLTPTLRKRGRPRKRDELPLPAPLSRSGLWVGRDRAEPGLSDLGASLPVSLEQVLLLRHRLGRQRVVRPRASPCSWSQSA